MSSSKNFIGYWISLLAAPFLLIRAPCFGEIIETHDAKVIETILEEADVNSLVIFDVDDVILVPSPEFGFRGPLRKAFVKKLKSTHNQEQQRHIWSAVFAKRTVRPVDPAILKVIRDLSKRQVPTIALTGWWTGPYGPIPRMEDLRLRDLAQVGISFLHSSPFKRNMIFPHLKTQDGTPLLKSGVILTALGDKGAVLKQALLEARLSFKKIIFIDDDLKNLQDVEKTCRSLGDFQGVHYTASRLAVPYESTPEKEALRFEILEKDHQWLTDKELQERVGGG